MIFQRANEGRTRATAEGVRFGRKPELTTHQRREALQRLDAARPAADPAFRRLIRWAAGRGVQNLA
jgi:hypothetical protein